MWLKRQQPGKGEQQGCRGTVGADDGEANRDTVDFPFEEVKALVLSDWRRGGKTQDRNLKCQWPYDKCHVQS